MKFAFCSAMPGQTGPDLRDESVAPWRVVDFRSIFEKTEYYIQGRPQEIERPKEIE